MENLVGMTAVQADYVRGLGGWWGGGWVGRFSFLPVACNARVCLSVCLSDVVGKSGSGLSPLGELCEVQKP